MDSSLKCIVMQGVEFIFDNLWDAKPFSDLHFVNIQFLQRRNPCVGFFTVIDY